MWKIETKQVSAIDLNGTITVVVDMHDDKGRLRVEDKSFTSSTGNLKQAIIEYVETMKSAEKLVKEDPLFKVGESFEV